MVKIRPYILLVFLVLSSVFLSPIRCVEAATEQQLKIVYIYKFLSFISLPGDVPDSYTIAILGTDSFGSAVDMLANKKVRGKSIMVERLAFLDKTACGQILIVSPDMAKKLPHILAEARKHQMLTISDIDGFINQGGIIGFVVEKGRVRFEVNLKAAKENDIKISSNLLEIASRVIR